MAARVNTKFVLLLSAVLVLLVGGVAAVAVYVASGSVESDIRQGDLYAADGDYQRAALSYGSAVRKRPGDLVVLDKFVNALQEAEVSNSADARKYLGQIQNALHLASENSGDPERLDAYYRQLYDWSQELDPGFAQRLRDVTDARLDIEPENLVARKYRGIAQVLQLTQDTPRDVREQAREDLEAVLAENPEDAEAIHHLALWKLAEAGRIDRPGNVPGDRPEEARQLRDDALKLAREALAKAPDDPQRQIQALQVLLHNQFIDLEKQLFVHEDEARQIVDRLEAQLLEDPSQRQSVLELASVLPRIDRKVVQRENLPATSNGMLRMANLLHTAAEKHPQDIVYVSQLGQTYARLGETDEALAQFEAARQLGITGTVDDVLRAGQMQMLGAFTAAKLQLQRATQAPDDAQKKAAIEAARLQLDALKSYTAQGPLVDEITGRLAMAEGKTAQALIHIDRALDTKGGRDLELLLLSGDLRRQQNAPGAALERFEQAMQLQPNHLPLRLAMARLYLQTGQMDKARQHLDAVLEQDPQNSEAAQLQSAMLLQQGDAQGALAVYERLSPEDQQKMEQAHVMTLAAAGQQDEARQLARKAFDRDRSSLQRAALLMRFTPDMDGRMTILDEAQAAGADARRVELLRQQLTLNNDSASLSVEDRRARQMEMVEPLLEDADPLTRAIAEARLYEQTGEPDKADAALAEAIRLDATDARVIELRYTRAVQDENWELAQEAVDAAATQNVDLASGDFYRARLAIAKGEHERAVSALQRALDARPVYGDGWRMLGEALLATRDVPRATEAFQRAVSQVPNDANALLGLARAYLLAGEQTRALEVMRQLVRVRATDELVQQYLALEQQVGDKQRAMAMRQQIAERSPQNHENRRALAVLQAQMGRLDDAMATVESLVAELGQNLETTATLAMVQSQAGRPEEGRAALQRYVGSRGGEATVDDYRVLAGFELQTGNFQAAVQAYEQARALEDKTEMPVSRELADLLFSRRMTEPAVELYQDVLAAKPSDVKVRLRLAEGLMRLERYEQASELLKEVDEDRVESLVLRAMLARQAGDSADALRLMNQAIKQEPGRADLYFQRAMVLATQEGRDRAVTEDLNSTLSRDPRHTPARLMLAGRHIAAGQLDQAQSELRSVLDYDASNAQARLQLVNLRMREGDLPGARLLAQQGAQQAPQDPTWPTLVAQLAGQQGDQTTAIAAWRQAMSMNPGPSQLSSLVTALLEANRPGEALPLFREHVSMVNAQPVLQALHGRTLVAAGQGDAGRQVLSNAVQAAANDQHVLTVVGQLSAALGPAEAMSLVQSVADGKPELSVAFAMAMAQLEMAQRQHAAAADRLARVEPALAAEHPLRPQVEQMLALNLYSSGQYDEARRVYEQILARDPENVGALNNLAYMLAKNLDDPQAALELANRAQQLRPRDARVLDTLGLVQLLTGDLRQARTTLTRSVELEQLPANTLHLAQVHAAEGLTNSARQMFQRAIALGQQQQDNDVVEEAQHGLDQLDSATP